MNQHEISRWEDRLRSDAFLIGPWLRGRAIRKLMRIRSPEATHLLARAIEWQHDSQVRATIAAHLGQVRDQSDIDQICTAWTASRHPALARLIDEKNWIASAPVHAAVLTALKLQTRSVLTARGPEILAALTAACSDPEALIAREAVETMRSLENPETIDFLCGQWAASRDALLAECIIKGRYVARGPADVRALSALKADRSDILAEAGVEMISPLLAACEDDESDIRERAHVALRQLRRSEAKDALCRLVLETDAPLARKIALEGRYAPADATERALFFFLTEQWAAYQELDFDQRLLGAVYESGNKRLRSRIAEKARQAGRTEWIAVIAGGRQERRLNEMSDEEWEAALVVLSESGRWPQMWRLAQVAPVDWSVKMLQRLRAAAWLPSDELSTGGFLKLSDVANRCRTEPAFLGRLMRCASPLNGHANHVSCLAVSGDSRWLLSGSDDRTVRLWNLSDGQPVKTLEGHNDWVASVAISPDQRIAASGGRDGVLCLWELPEGNLLRTVKAHGEEIRCLAFSADGELVATGSNDRRVRLWRVADGQPQTVLKEHQDIVSCVSVSPRGSVLASGSFDNTVQLWNLPDGTHRATLSGHRALVSCLAFCHGTDLLASGSKDRSVILWNAIAGTKLKRLKGHRDDISCLACSLDGALLASGSWDSTVRLWRLPDGEHLETLGALDTESGHSGWVNCVAFSPDGCVLATGGSDGVVRLWSVPGGAPLKALEQHTDRVTCVAFTPDGRTLISGGWDNSVCLWKSELARLRRLPIQSLTFQDMDWTEKALTNSKLSDAERNWLELLHGLMLWQRRYDIQLGEREQISVGEFDIEIAP